MQNTDPSVGDWYSARPDTEPVGDWYRTAPEKPEGQRPAGPTPPVLRREPTEEQRRRSRRMKAVSLTVCAVLVCAAAVMAVYSSGLVRRLTAVRPSQTYTFGTDEFGFDFDGAADSGLLPEQPYEDFREYFDNYFTGSNEIGLPAAPTGTGVTLPLRPYRGAEMTLQEIYDAVSPAVVGINTFRNGDEYSWGTGVVFSPEGYIITNTHVLQGCTDAKVVFSDGGEYGALLVGADEASDIAVLYVQTERPLPCAEFGRSDALKVGDVAVAIGNPISQDYTGTMTDGIISAIDRNVTYDGHSMTLLQTNAALNEGNSGGPLINAGGQVIGITNMKIMSSYYATVEGIGFAIPSSVVKQIADQLIEKGVVPGEPTIGIVAGTVSSEAMLLYDVPAGLYVSEVSEGSDAKAKGLEPGDVITAVDGRSVSTVADINRIKEASEVGDSLTFTVWRDGETFKLKIELVDKADIK